MPQTMIDATSAAEQGRMSEVPDGKAAQTPLEAWVSAPAKPFVSTLDAPKKQTKTNVSPNFNSMADEKDY
jgi:hypothetical protein|tara:strand:+ start:3559 stop:3768 length:210 start_codon:yes stop_codon:yes gene_type:complete